MAHTLDSFAYVTDAEVIGPHKLRLTFEDGTVGDVAFTDEDWQGVLAPLRDPAVFAQVRVDSQLGTLVWPGEIDVAPEPLYREAKRRATHTPAA